MVLGGEAAPAHPRDLRRRSRRQGRPDAHEVAQGDVDRHAAWRRSDRVDPRGREGGLMYVVVWRFQAKPGREHDFEQAYGPAGDWVTLFRSDPEYVGTELLRDLDRPGY